MANYRLQPDIAYLYSINNKPIQLKHGIPLLFSKIQDQQSIHEHSLIISLSLPSGLLNELEYADLEMPVKNIFSPCECFHNCMLFSLYEGKIIDSQPLWSVESDMNNTMQSLNGNTKKCNNLCISLTEILQKANELSLISFKIRIDLKAYDLIFELDNDANCHPQLYLSCYDSLNPIPQPVHTSPSILLLNTYDSPRMLIAANDKIYFSNMTTDPADNIIYDEDLRTILVKSAGYYYISWIINLLGCGSLKCLSISLKNLTAGTAQDFRCPCVMPCEMCGQNVIHVKNGQSTYALVNTSEAKIQYTNIPLQASLIIFKL